MDTLIIFLISLALAMDCFTIAITNSSVSGYVKPGIPLKAAILFSFSHIIMLGLGYWLGGLLTSLVAGVEIWVAFFILSSVGGKMIFEAYRKRPEAKVFDINNIKVILGLSIATAMDAFLVGIVLAILAGPIGMASFMVALAVFVFTLAGLAGGINLGLAFARKTAYFGGTFFLIVAIWLLMEIFRSI